MLLMFFWCSVYTDVCTYIYFNSKQRTVLAVELIFMSKNTVSLHLFLKASVNCKKCLHNVLIQTLH